MLLEKNYSTMCSEVLEILKYCPKTDVDKIPKKLIESLEINKQSNLNVSIDPNIGIFEQKVSNETIIMMFIIFRNYWATEEEKSEVDNILSENEIKYKELYSINNLVKENSKQEIQNENIENKVDKEEENVNEFEVKTEETSLTEYHETFITKLVNFIKNFFKNR